MLMQQSSAMTKWNQRGEDVDERGYGCGLEL